MKAEHLLTRTERELAMKGQFYTPLIFAEKGLTFLNKDNIIWDPACGTGNLLDSLPVEYHKNLYLSDIDREALDVAKKRFPTATVFYHDFLNDEIPRVFLENDLTIYMNPPYGTGGAGTNNSKGKPKTGISFTKTRDKMKEEGFGKASTELTNQFMYRLWKELPNADIGLFFREKLFTAENSRIFPLEILDGFITNSKYYNTKAEFPILFYHLKFSDIMTTK